MGLDFVGSKAHWSYTGFMRFREKLAKEIGIDLNKMKGFGGQYKGLPDGVIAWDGVKDEIVPLLNHSDCDGHLTPGQCSKIYPRLLQILERWPDDDFDKKEGLKLAIGMRECCLTKTNLKFC